MAVSASAEALSRGAMTPVPHRVRVPRAQETADTWTLELEPLGEAVRPRAGQFDMLYAFGVGEVPISTSGDHAGDGPLTHTVRAVGAGDEGALRARRGRARRGTGPVRQRVAARRGRRWGPGRRRGRHRPRTAATGGPPRARAPRRLRRGLRARRRPHAADDLLFVGGDRAVARSSRRRGRRHRGRGRVRLARARGARHDADPGRGVRSRRTRPRSSAGPRS